MIQKHTTTNSNDADYSLLLVRNRFEKLTWLGLVNKQTRAACFQSSHSQDPSLREKELLAFVFETKRNEISPR